MHFVQQTAVFIDSRDIITVNPILRNITKI